MGTPKLHLPKNGKSPHAFKRVIRLDDAYICGICRTEHQDPNSAIQCLEDCFVKFINQNPVVRHRIGHELTFRCRFCARDFKSHGNALNCANECKAYLLQKHRHDIEVSMSMMNIDISPEKKPRKISKPKLVQTIAAPQKPTAIAASSQLPITKSKPEAEQPKQNASPDTSATSAISPSPNSEAIATTASKDADAIVTDSGTPAAPKSKEEDLKEKKAKLKNETDKFYRDGARYVCRVCNEKYFTRMEVDKCFDSH